MKAELQQQWRLLDLQKLDTRLDQIDHRLANLPQAKELAELTKKADTATEEMILAQTAVMDVEREIARSEADVQQVRDRAARDQARLDAGTGMTSRDLTSLQHELETLARRQSALEEVEIEVMERQESAEARLAELTASRDEAQAEVDRLTAERDAAIAELDAERTEVVRPRADLAGGIDDKLLALYDRIRDSSGGLGAAEFTHGRCGGCRLELNPVDVSAIERAASDEVVRCEECGRILVRTHSGD